MSDEVVALGGDRFEQRVAVDRRRLEAMITGRPDDLGYHYPNADGFFQEIMSQTGATISWPAQLKIGAKTKRDPFVKVQGSGDQVVKAAALIAERLQTKKARVTLKIEIHHSLHSNLIGKGGKGIQQIMKYTQCHIHFPDSNKYSDNQVKSDQVSIAGTPEQVDAARKYLRDILPFAISFELPWLGVGHPVSLPGDLVTWQLSGGGLYLCTVRGSLENEITFVHGLATALQRFGLSEDYPVLTSIAVPVKSETVKVLKSPENWQRLADLACDLGNQPTNDGFIVVSGPIDGILAARKFIIGLSTAILSFDVPSECNLTSVSLEHHSKISATYKKRSPQATTVMLKGAEDSCTDMLRIRTRILNSTTGTGFQLTPSLPIEAAFDYPGAFDLLRTSPDSGPKTPDPEDSPLAASILKGVKDIDRNTGHWKRKTDREQMLLKAAQVFDELPGSNPRYPTDHWSGYGFSYSLPSDLLKGLLSSPPAQEEPIGRLIEGRNARSPPRNNGLCSVREEDELSDFSDSLSSRSNRSRNICFEPSRRAAFSASTSIFDSAPAISDLSWDIRNFTDPAMVLTQLGCSEYLALMREQEIDMHAFLLLDEQNLKDIGVSTIGARKKIHHAIRKLRDSARLHGYSI